MTALACTRAELWLAMSLAFVLGVVIGLAQRWITQLLLEPDQRTDQD